MALRACALPRMRMLTITANAPEWHEAFHDYVARVFPGVSFRRWAVFGGWQEHYRVFALFDATRIVASASLTRMDLVLHGRAVRGWQLGAVGTDPNYRRRGLQHRLLQHVLAQRTPRTWCSCSRTRRFWTFTHALGFPDVRRPYALLRAESFVFGGR